MCASIFDFDDAVRVLADDDVPPAGTACHGCRGRGHLCQAKRYRGETPLCLCCMESQDCPVVKSRLLTEEQVLARFDTPAQPVRDVTPVDPAKRIAKPDPVIPARVPTGLGIQRWTSGTEPEVARRHKAEAARRRERYALSEVRPVQESGCEVTLARIGLDVPFVSDAPVAVDEPEIFAVAVELEEEKPMPLQMNEEMILAIQSAPETESTNALANRLKIGYNTAQKYRKMSPRETSKKVALAERDKPATGVPIDMENVGPRVVALGSPLPVTIEGGAVTLQAARIDAWFAKLPLERKAELFFAEVGL